MRYYLIGFMGAGKTKLGRAIALAENLPFIDMDASIEANEGSSIPDIFDSKGEDFFRKLEAKTLRATKQHDGLVISTGGGTPCFRNNMDWMIENGITIFLNQSIENLITRLKRNPYKRPLLLGKSDAELVKLIQEKLDERMPFYQKASHTLQVTENLNSNISELQKIFQLYYS